MLPDPRDERNLPQSSFHHPATKPAWAATPQRKARRWGLALAGIVMGMLTVGCNFSGLLQPPTPTPVPTRVLAPTFTPTPQALQPLVVVTPPQNGTPGVIIIQPTIEPDKVVIAIPPTDTPVQQPTPTPLPAQPAQTPGEQPGVAVTPGQPPPPTPAEQVVAGTPVAPAPTATLPPAPTPTPYIVVESGYASLRMGPGLDYPLVAQLGPGIPVAIIGRSTDGAWYELCCVNGNSVWVPAAYVRAVNDVAGVALKVAQPPPTVTPTFTPTWTPTVTTTPSPTPYPFERAIGPQFFPTNNDFLTVWAYLFVGALNDTNKPEEPAPGYYLDVKFEGVSRPNTNDVKPSANDILYSAPPGSGNRVKYNYKYEYRPPDNPTPAPGGTPTPRPCEMIGQGKWTATVIDGAGNKLSEPVEFTTDCNNPNREVYLGWVRVR